jgi:acetoacetyl-CoA reductase/3-oxoacyl-[acyl-carrier protein] reductase
MNVAFTYRASQEQALAVVQAIEAIGGAAMCIRADQANPGEIAEAIRAVRERFGPVDVLVNNAGMVQEKPFESITDEDWDLMLAINLRGPFIFARELLPDMKARGWGRIINIVSIGGQWGGMNQVHYAAAKAGLINLTRSLAKLYSKYGIASNAVAPGLVATGMIANELSTPAGQEKARAIPAGRIASTDDVAAAVVFLARDDAGYITGQTINVNGGMYCV